MPVDEPESRESQFQSSPTGPRIAPPRAPADEPATHPDQPSPRLPRMAGNKWRFWSVTIFVLLISGYGIRVYRDLSRPEAWDYWKDHYFSPSLTSSLIADSDGRMLAVSGEIGAAGASWLREKLDEGHLIPGDLVLLSSPGGNLAQAMLMGEMIRSRGLTTAVGTADASGGVRPARCASACVLVYAGGKVRYGVEGSALGVHQFYSVAPERDPISGTQSVVGMLLGYMRKMGISPTIVEAMSETRDVRWLGAKEASAMNLVTRPVGAEPRR